jgi:hypothetical protein
VTNLYGAATSGVATVTFAFPYPAQTLTWDANPGTAGALDGNGTWNYTTAQWWTGSSDETWWTNDTASFGAGGAGPYTVTLGTDISASAITFNSGNYTITNTPGLTLTLQGPAAITANAAGTISAPLSTGTNTFLKAGAGKLTIVSGGLTCGQTFVSAGTLEVLAMNADAPYVITNGATLEIGYTPGGGYANTGMQIYGDGTSATTGLYLAGGTTYNVSGTPTLLGAPTTIRQYGSGLAAIGNFDINTTGLWCTSAASGSVIASNIQIVSDGYGMSAQVDAGANTATGDLIINGPLNVNAQNGIYGFVKRGTGSLLLNAVATATNCALEILAGSAICGIDQCIGTNASLEIDAGATLFFNGTSQTVANVLTHGGAPGMAGTLSMSINKGGTPNSTVLTEDDGNPMTLGGNLTVTNVGGTLVLGDTFTLFSSSGGFAGGFANVTLPTETNGLGWLNNLAIDGTIQVIKGSVPPSIVTDLLGITNYAYVGGSSTYTITAAGDPTLRYQWMKNRTTPVGSDSPTLTLAPLTLADGGYYSVTVSNDYGSAQSQSNYLVVEPASSYIAAVAPDGPLSLWPLSETAPATAYDYWSTNNGAQNGTLTLGVAGPVPPAYAGFNSNTTAYEFDGATAYINCGTGPALSGTTDFTLEAWINTTNVAEGVILQQRYSGGYNGEYLFAVNGNGTVYFYIFGDNAYQFNFSSPAASRRVNDGNWHHVAAVRSGINGFIYIDGSLVASASGTFVAGLDPTFTVAIGEDFRDSVFYFDGLMCDVAIYNHALSAARIGKHASEGVLGNSSLALDIVPGGWVEDSKPAGTPHDGQNLGASWVASRTDANSVKRSGVARFSSGAQIATPANPDFNSSTGTICFWMLTSMPAPGTGMMLVDRSTNAGMVIILDGTPTGGIDVKSSGNPILTAGGYVTDGNWHHVAVVYDQSASGAVSVYVDGASVGSQANTAAWSWPTNQEIELGRSHTTSWQEYNGLMDDFRIYSSELTSTEIATIAAPATSDTLVDTNTLEVRYNFDTATGAGQSISWPIGVLQSAPVLGSPAVWTPLNTTSATYPFLPPYPVTNSALFYRLKL